jgi:protein-disulfide isomerase
MTATRKKHIRTPAPNARPARGSRLAPMVILAAGVAAALGIAFVLSTGEAGTTEVTSVDAMLLDTYSGGGHDRGAENPAVTLIEYGDFGCPTCAIFHTFLDELMRRMPDELAIEFHNYPIPVSTNSIQAAIAAEAAAEQGHYWEMHDTLYNTQPQWTSRADAVEFFTSMAGQIGLDTTKFVADMARPDVQNRVISDRAQGEGLQISGTPSFFINGRRLNALPSTVDEFEILIRGVVGQ